MDHHYELTVTWAGNLGDGTSTYRGGGRPVGWERDRARYDYLYPENRGRGYEGRWF